MKKLLMIALLGATVGSAWGAAGFKDERTIADAYIQSFISANKANNRVIAPAERVLFLTHLLDELSRGYLNKWRFDDIAVKNLTTLLQDVVKQNNLTLASEILSAAPGDQALYGLSTTKDLLRKLVNATTISDLAAAAARIRLISLFNDMTAYAYRTPVISPDKVSPYIGNLLNAKTAADAQSAYDQALKAQGYYKS